MTKTSEHIYRIRFIYDDEEYEIYAKNISHCHEDLFGFLMIEGIIFGENSQVLVDPVEEKLRMEFEGVKSTFIPLNDIIRIDEVEKTGRPKVTAVKGGNNVRAFPFSGSGVQTPTKHP